MRKEKGGLGSVIYACLILHFLENKVRNLLTKPHILVGQVFKEKYFPSEDYLSSNFGSNPSFI